MESAWVKFCKKFGKVAGGAAIWVGTPWAFALAFTVVIVWAASGHYYHYSDTWQLVINTGTTIVTFLMVFLIQNTQNRDARALHLKLDELIRSVKPAHNDMINIEKLSDEELAILAKRYEAIAKEFESRRTEKAAGLLLFQASRRKDLRDLYVAELKDLYSAGVSAQKSRRKIGWSPVDKGYIDWAAQSRTLKDVGYHGAVSLETHGSVAATHEDSTRISWAGMKKDLLESGTL